MHTTKAQPINNYDTSCTTPSLRITQNNNDSDASSLNTTRANPSHWPHVTRLTPLAQMRAQNTLACHRENHHIAIPTHSTKKKDSAVQRNFKACLLSHHLLNIKRWIEKWQSTKIIKTSIWLTRKTTLTGCAWDVSRHPHKCQIRKLLSLISKNSIVSFWPTRPKKNKLRRSSVTSKLFFSYLPFQTPKTRLKNRKAQTQ